MPRGTGRTGNAPGGDGMEIDVKDAAAEVVVLHFLDERQAAAGAGDGEDPVRGPRADSRATAQRHWAYARAWLRCVLAEGGSESTD